jgi:hypothetical protein
VREPCSGDHLGCGDDNPTRPGYTSGCRENRPLVATVQTPSVFVHPQWSSLRFLPVCDALESRVDPLDFAVQLQYERLQGLRPFCVSSRCPKRSRGVSNPKRLERFSRPISTSDRRDTLVSWVDCGPGAVANKASPIFVTSAKNARIERSTVHRHATP